MTKIKHDEEEISWFFLNEVTKKLAELTIEAFIANQTPIKPTSIRPIVVNLVLDENGVIWSFGNNSGGQLGHGDTENRSTPTEIT